MRAPVLLALVLLCLGSGQSRAQEAGDENSDLNLIPQAVETTRQETSNAERPKPGGRFFLENASTGWVNKGLQVPVPVNPPNWQNRTSLDLDYSRQLGEKVRLTLSNRLNVIEGDGIGFPSRENVRNDFREGYLSAEILPRTYLEAGRINLKSGIALGYNPTDYFKTRTLVDIASIDPSAIRDNRLGSLMIKAQKIWENGSLTLAYSPAVENQSPLQSTHASFDPLFGQTNSAHRFLASLSYNILDLNPQALVCVDNIGTHFGLNISRVLGHSVVAYGEWSGVRESTLTKRALEFGKQTASLPPEAPLLPQSDAGKGFRNDLAVGLSWTSSFNLTLNLEYHYHQAGFGAADFANWLSLGRSNPQLAKEFWFIRQYAQDQQEPLMEHQFFLRLDWQDMIPSRLNAGGIMFISPYDGSILTQASAQYFISRNWTIGLYLGGIVGNSGSVEGSLPWVASGVLQVVRYF